jgi:hypothetical protein
MCGKVKNLIAAFFLARLYPSNLTGKFVYLVMKFLQYDAPNVAPQQLFYKLANQEVQICLTSPPLVMERLQLNWFSLCYPKANTVFHFLYLLRT